MTKTYRNLSAFIAVFVLLTATACITGCTEPTTLTEDELRGTNWRASDDSFIEFGEGGEFSWYLDENVRDDNYQIGTYAFTRGKDAEKLLSEKYADLGVTAEELNRVYSSSSDGLLSQENFCVLVVDFSEFMLDGQLQNIENKQTVYYGFIDDAGKLSFVNTNTSTPYSWTKEA